MYKNLFEKLKLWKNFYFQNKLKQFEKGIKNTCKVVKVITGRSKVYNDIFPKSLNMEITSKKTIAIVI